jgi:AraC family transcriptional regulator of adaptative response / DNA-3-methyladenine glycosylase II
VLGQQVTVRSARTLASRLVLAAGEQVETCVDGLDRLFPSAAAVADVDPETFAMPRSRVRALVATARALADGDVCLDRGHDRDDVRRALLALPGIGPWTADYVAMRALGHPDVFLPKDTGTRDALRALGHDATRAEELSESWRPWRSYAQVHLWNTVAAPEES